MPQPLKVVAVDGVAVNSQDGSSEPGALIAVTDFRLPPASRVEFLVEAPTASVQSAQLVTLNILTGQNGDDDPNRPLFNIQLGADDDESSPDNRVGKFSTLDTSQRRFAGLATAPIAVKRLVYFNENQPSQFFMDVQGVPEQTFNPNAPPAITATQGTVEEWTVENHTLENHEFHMHQIHFLVESQNNFKINSDRPAPGITGQYLDMVEVPNWDGNPAHPFPSVTLRLDFRGHDVGDFVFHCHILNHEDLGMMNIIRVVSPSASVTGSVGKSATVSPKPEGSTTGSPVAPSSPGGMANMRMN